MRLACGATVLSFHAKTSRAPRLLAIALNFVDGKRARRHEYLETRGTRDARSETRKAVIGWPS